MIKFYALKTQYGLILLKDETHFLGSDGWSFFYNGEQYSVRFLVNSSFLNKYDDMFEAQRLSQYPQLLLRNQELLLKGIQFNDVIMTKNISNIQNFNSKVIVGEKAGRYFSIPMAEEILNFK